jgi:hypothetical protein
VSHRIKVPQSWVEDGRSIEIQLPRHLRCAACEGGGCDACERSGALTVRGRGEPPEILQVTLPQLNEATFPPERTILIRIPEQGGLPPEGEDIPRGNLLLAVNIGDAPDSGIQVVEPAPVLVEPPPQVLAKAPRPPLSEAKKVALVALLVLLWIAILVWARWSGFV